MKKISEHLGEIIVALACVALLISAVTVFAAPVGNFFGSIVTKEVALGNQVMEGIENIDASNIGVDGNGGGAGGDEGSTQTYQIIAGSGQTYSTGTLSFTSNAPFNKFAGVKVNNEVVDPVNYTVTEGSTIITFTEEYSQLLANGDYEIEVLATDGKASAPFDVDISGSGSTPSIDTSDIFGTWEGDTYGLFFDEMHGDLGKVIYLDRGPLPEGEMDEKELFYWELDENGDIVFDVYAVLGEPEWMISYKSLIYGKKGVVSADGKTITVGDMTFTRQ